MPSFFLKSHVCLVFAMVTIDEKYYEFAWHHDLLLYQVLVNP